MPGSVIFVNTRTTALEADPCFVAAATRGLDVVLLADRPSTAPAGTVAEVVALDTYDMVSCVANANEIATRRGDVRGVVTWGDRDVEPAAAIADALGLPGPSVTAARLARNKFATRSVVAKARPDLVPRFARVTDDAGLRLAVDTIGFPAVLKPTGASASRGVFAVSDSDEALAAFAELSRFTRPAADPIFRYYPGEMIYEEALGGSEHSVEGIVVGGQLVTALITDKWVREPFFLEYQQIAGSALPTATRRLLIEAAHDVVRAVGFRDGAFHLEMRVESSDRVRMLELNARTGGNYITSHLVPWSTGYDFLGNVLAVATGEQPQAVVDPPVAVAAGSRQVITDGVGKLTGIRNVDVALSIPGMRAFTYETPRGSSVAQPPASYTSSIVASLLGVAGAPGDVARVLEDAEAALTVEIG